MLAGHYGYWISEDAAADTPLTRQWLGEEERTPQNEPGRLSSSLILVGALTCIAGVGILVGSQSIGWALALLGTGVWLLLLGAALKPDKERREPELGRLPLHTSPWQAWPCRLEGSTVILLDPQRKPVARYRGDVPASTWDRMTDGYGVLWICGDLRLNVAVADPGGAPVWAMRPVTDEVREARPHAEPNLIDLAAEETVRQAGATVTQQWLEELGFGRLPRVLHDGCPLSSLLGIGLS
ncbi:MAG TPA: hypothetical protein VFU12_17450 [Glycomyces sp.]|nr:hypothetical protein [Glycomyces sp.]